MRCCAINLTAKEFDHLTTRSKIDKCCVINLTAIQSTRLMLLAAFSLQFMCSACVCVCVVILWLRII